MMLGSHYAPDGWVDVPLGRLEQYQRHIDPAPAGGGGRVREEWAARSGIN